MVAPDKKHLLVEGQVDKYAIVQLMAAHVAWGNKPSEWPVVIKAVGSVGEILSRGYIATLLKSRDVEILGVLIDADDQFTSRWESLRRECKGSFPGVPDDLPSTGLVLENTSGARFGAWIMPDNKSRGMLETFLQFLVPSGESVIWDKATTAVRDARSAGAKCKECHVDKANIHTWLAWQDPPGESFGNALVQTLLDPKAPQVDPFVKWFRNLYLL